MNPLRSPIFKIFFCLLMSNRATAATWHVDDDVPVPGDGMSWANAFSNLQDALAASSSGDSIQIAEGIYYPDHGGGAVDNDRTATFQLIDGVTIRGGYPNGGGARDFGSHRTFLSGDIDQDDVDAPSGGNSHSVVTGSGTDATAVLSGCTITSGLADVSSDDAFLPTNSGGAVYAIGGSPAFRNCIFINNSAGFGGAVFNKDSSSPSFVSCLFAGNKASFFGGGMNNRSSSSPSLVSCTFTANSADGFGGGGAITNFSSANPTLTNCILWNNAENGNTNTPEASVDDRSGSSATVYEFSLIRNIDPGGTNLDGTDTANDPSFLIPGDPTAAPSRDGDFRLETGSPALDAGDNAANSDNQDVIGNPRTGNGTIDLGAYEGAFPPVLFDTLHVDPMVGSPGDGSDWAQAFATLQDALDGAVSGQTVLVAKGTYYPDEGGSSTDGDRTAAYRLVNGVTVTGGYPNGGGTRDLAANPTILSGDIDQNDAGEPAGGNSYTVVLGSGRDATAVLDGFIITGGLADDSGGEFGTPTTTGGGIFINDGRPTFLNCILRNNFAIAGGGAFNTAATPTFVNCVVSGNKTTGFGGGFHNRSGSNVVYINTTFSGNSASSNGGAISNFLSNPSLTNCIVWNNEAFGVTNTSGASVQDGGGSTSDYEHCLIENISPGETNLDGTDAGNNPLFPQPLDPATAPSASGDLRLSSGSSALDAGDTLANPQTIDLLGNPRVSGIEIDLGAYEGAVVIPDTDGDGLSDSFELAHTTPPSNSALAPDSNDDQDPFTALEEFAFGLDPNVGNGNADAFSTAIVEDGLMEYLSITWEINPAAALFVDILPEQSSDLGAVDAWSNGDTLPIAAPAGKAAARSTSAMAAEDKDFLRVRVEKK